MKTIQDAAFEFRWNLTHKRRDTGETFVCPVEDAPDWVKDIIWEAHFDKLPNDWSYVLIKHAAEALIYDGDPEGENAFSFGYAEADGYPRHELLDWVGSHGDRWDLADRAIAGELESVHRRAADLDDALHAGLTQEATDVYYAIWQGLRGHVEEHTEDEEGDA